MKMKRREVFALSGVAAAGAVGYAGMQIIGGTSAEASLRIPLSACGELTRLAIVQDCLQLMRSSDLPVDFRANLLKHRHFVMTASQFPFTTKVIAFLEEARSGWKVWDKTQGPRAALGTGYLLHRAACRRFDRERRTAEPPEVQSEVSRHQDAAVLASLLPDSLAIEREKLNRLFRTFEQRLKTGIHTFLPDWDDDKEWMWRLIHWDARQPGLFQGFAEACWAARDEKGERPAANKRFLDAADPLIRVARAPEALSVAELNRALQSTLPQSLYAKALADSYRSLQAASQFLAGSLGAEELQNRILDATSS